MRRSTLSIAIVFVIGILAFGYLWYSIAGKQNEKAAGLPVAINQLTQQQLRTMFDRTFDLFDSGSGSSNTMPALGFFVDYSRLYIRLIGTDSILCNPAAITRVADGALETDLEKGVLGCSRDERFLKATPEEVKNASLQLTFISGRRPASNDLDVLKTQMALGIHGIELEKNGHNIFLRETVAIHRNFSHERMLKQLCREVKWKDDCYLEPGSQLFIHDAQSFIARPKNIVSRLYRENPPLEISDISPQLIEKRLGLIEEWFMNFTGDDGMIKYLYYPSSDRHPEDNGHLRQLATLWSITELVQHLESDALDQTIEQGISHYLGKTICTETGCYINVNQKNSIGQNAFMVLALINKTGYPEAEEWREKLAAGILYQQQPDGSYRTFFASDDHTGGSDYYPGEAMLALMQLHSLTGSEEYLNSVNKAFPYYRDYWRANRNSAFIPWHTQAYLLLYRQTRNKELADFVFEMNDWLIDRQQLVSGPYADLIGGFNRGNPGTTTSVYLEGFNDAFVMAQITGDSAHEKKYRETIQGATRFMLVTQYTPENSFYLPNPSRAIGGFRSSLVNNTLRIDNAQHALRALIQALDNRIFE